jgi:CRP-like cAMP-binding protein
VIKKTARFSKSESTDMETIESFFSNSKSNGYKKGHIKTYPSQSVIFKQETPANAVYLIEHGYVKLVRVAPNGNKVIIGIRRRDWFLGAPAVFLDKSYSFSAITLVPTSVTFILAKDFIDLVGKNEQFSCRIHRQLSQEIFNQMKKVEMMSCMSAQDRLKQFLCDLIDEQKSVGSNLTGFSLPLNNQELAQLIAISPEHLCRVLKEMELNGLIKRDKGMLLIPDPAELLNTSAS